MNKAELQQAINKGVFWGGLKLTGVLSLVYIVLFVVASVINRETPYEQSQRRLDDAILEFKLLRADGATAHELLPVFDRAYEEYDQLRQFDQENEQRKD